MTITVQKPTAEEYEKIQQWADSCHKAFSNKDFLSDLKDPRKSLVIAKEVNNVDSAIVAFGLAEKIRAKDFSFENPTYELIQTRFFSKKEYAQEAEKKFIGYWLIQAKAEKINEFFVQLIE